ncbi:SCO6745 family protein [Thermoactinospora rubra]|uniref:SCO6745 family protein n=1 Tax=Thermoactinospora rubra TaxID=1088767 RepID=UPI001F0AEC8E|nr:hypothetical protein [Thermoactinospora rubra]
MADPRTTAAAVKGPIGVLGGGFMISREAKALCEKYGLGPRELYFRGRCGVLGEVHPDVVTSVAVFFPAGHVTESWEGGRKLPVEEAVAAYAGACQDWGRRKLGGFDGCARIAELLEKVVREASVLGAPLFAGWRAVPLPDDPPARAAQLMHLVRELRGGLHAAAVLAAGLHPLEATLAAEHSGTPFGQATGEMIARFFQWPEPYPVPSPEVVERRRQVEERTDDLMAPFFAVLTDAEREELAELVRLGHAP